jgi:hypothetical protein
MRQEIPLSEAELAAIDDRVAAFEKLLVQLADVGFKAAGRCVQVPLGNDVVAAENGPYLVTGIAIGTRFGTPARTIFRTAVRRRSWNSFPVTPARLQADLTSKLHGSYQV